MTLKFMKYLLFCLYFLGLSSVFAQNTSSCARGPAWFQSACQHINKIWTQGNNELYITGYAWHNRYTYSAQKIASYNEAALGGGMGKGLYDEYGNWHGIYALAFLDSHQKIEPVTGYAYLKTLPLNDNNQFGLGVSLFVTARPDIFNYYPFPGLLPWATFTHKKATIATTYIPGAKGAGNVLFIFGKWQL